MSFMEELQKECKVKAWETTAATCFVYFELVIKVYVYVEPPSSHIYEPSYKIINNTTITQFTKSLMRLYTSFRSIELIMIGCLPLSGVQGDGPWMLHISS